MTPYPLRFSPIFKRTLWGGRKLAAALSKEIGEESDYAESWEIVDHGEDQSVVVGGDADGWTLAELIRDQPQWFSLPNGANANSGSAFPLLLKYLDCNRVLSVQVHPDDQYGSTLQPPDLGKTEAWFIVDSDPGSLVYAGLKPGVDRQQLDAAIESGTAEELLHSFHPQPGDCVFIPAGTVHALGEGLLVAEIQQSSDTTFRLYDWNRVGGDGKPRELHIDHGLQVTDFETGPVNPTRVSHETSGWQTMVECSKFVLQSLAKGVGSIKSDQQFHIVTVPRGTATLTIDGVTSNLTTGQSLLLPIGTPDAEMEVSTGGIVLGMFLPG